MFLLDTNVVSELRKAQTGKADPNVVAWSKSVDADRLFISVITIMELELGVLLMESKDATQGRVLRVWLEQQSYRSSLEEPFLLIPPWRGTVSVCTYQISAMSVTRSSRRRHLCTT